MDARYCLGVAGLPRARDRHLSVAIGLKLGSSFGRGLAMRTVLLAVALVLALLVVTNPSRAEFNSWAQNWVVRKIEDEARKHGENPRDGAQIGGTIAGFIIPNLPIERQNFLAFSLY